MTERTTGEIHVETKNFSGKRRSHSYKKNHNHKIIKKNTAKKKKKKKKKRPNEIPAKCTWKQRILVEKDDHIPIKRKTQPQNNQEKYWKNKTKQKRWPNEVPAKSTLFFLIPSKIAWMTVAIHNTKDMIGSSSPQQDELPTPSSTFLTVHLQ